MSIKNHLHRQYSKYHIRNLDSIPRLPLQMFHIPDNTLFSPQRLIKTKPNMQTTIPIIWRIDTFSLYKKYPTIKSTHARPMFATTLAVLTCQPAR